MTLRTRILALTVGTAASVLVLFAVPLVVLLHRSASEDARQTATDTARGVADYLSTGNVDRGALDHYVARVNDRDDTYLVEAVLPDGSAVGASVPGFDESDPDGDGGRGVGGSRDPDRDGDDDRYGDLGSVSQPTTRAVDGGDLVVVGVSTVDGPVMVAAFVPASQVRQTVLERALVLAGAAAMLLLAAAAAGELVARRLVRHLEAAARTADRLGEGDLTARVADEGPEEVRRVGAALNRLAGRIDELLVAERETVADLSHRLRTPLTAVRLDVESLPDSERKEELEDHLTQVERTLTAVIHAARRPEREGAAPHCDAGEVARDRFEFWAPLAEDQGRDISLAVAEGMPPIRVAATDLRSALDALIENAVAHTPEGTAISVVVARDDGAGVFLEVRDRGPGFAPVALTRGRSDRGSTGLGLDIARSCAEASGGRLELVAEDGWSVVRLVLGAR